MSFTGDFIKKRRADLNFSQKYVAAQLGFSNSFMAKIEQGNCSLPSAYVLKIAKILDVERDELIKVMKRDFGIKMTQKTGV